MLRSKQRGRQVKELFGANQNKNRKRKSVIQKIQNLLRESDFWQTHYQL